MRLRKPPGHDLEVLPAVWSGGTSRCVARVRLYEFDVI